MSANGRRKLFQTGYRDTLRSIYPRLPWPSPGRGETDDPSRGLPMFRSYGTRVAREAPELQSPVIRDELDMPLPSKPLLIPFALAAALNVRRMAVSERILGPAIIESLDCVFAGVAGSSNAVFSIFVSETPENQATITPRPSGEDIYTTNIESAGVIVPDDVSGYMIGDSTALVNIHHRLDYHVPLDQFFIKPSICQTAGGLESVNGWITVRRLHPGLTIAGTRAYRSQ